MAAAQPRPHVEAGRKSLTSPPSSQGAPAGCCTGRPPPSAFLTSSAGVNPPQPPFLLRQEDRTAIESPIGPPWGNHVSHQRVHGTQRAGAGTSWWRREREYELGTTHGRPFPRLRENSSLRRQDRPDRPEEGRRGLPALPWPLASVDPGRWHDLPGFALSCGLHQAVWIPAAHAVVPRQRSWPPQVGLHDPPRPGSRVESSPGRSIPPGSDRAALPRSVLPASFGSPELPRSGRTEAGHRTARLAAGQWSGPLPVYRRCRMTTPGSRQHGAPMPAEMRAVPCQTGSNPTQAPSCGSPLAGMVPTA